MSTEKAPAQAQPKTKRLFVVVGRTELEKGGLSWALLEIKALEELKDLPEKPPLQDERIRLYDGLKFIRAGTVVSYMGTESTISPSTMEFVQQLDQTRATSWAIRDRAVVDARKLRKATEKEGGRDLPFELLEPWRKLIAGSAGERRIAMIARLLNYVERGVK